MKLFDLYAIPLFVYFYIKMPDPVVFQYRPGWIAFVEGECSSQEYAILDRDMKDIMMRVMYPFEYFNLNYYYHLGFDRFSWQVTRKVDEKKEQQRDFDRPKFLRPYIAYFYNRQLIIQMTYIPRLYPGQEVSIPLNKSPAMEIQIDTMAFLPTQQDRRGNRNTLGLIVILEPFSRFMWIHPYGTIQRGESRNGEVYRQRGNMTAAQAFRSFQQAFSTNGPNATQFYNYLRDKIKRVVTDNGSEFKDDFRRLFQESQIFPNAQLYTATAKSQTFGRPTNTGPVEIAIGSLRRVLRDYEIAINQSFLGDFSDLMKNLRQVVHAYNNMFQMSTLRSKEKYEYPTGRKRRALLNPWKVAQYTKQGAEGVDQVSEYMTFKRNEKLKKYQDVLDGYEMDAPLEGAYVRLYYPPPPLSKLVRFRVSLELYRVVRIYPANNSMVAEIRNVDTNAIQRDIGLKRLVLVKQPMDGPQRIEDGLRQVVNEQVHNQQAVVRANNQHARIQYNPVIQNAIMGQAADRDLPLQAGPLGNRNGNARDRDRGQPAGGPVRQGTRDRRKNPRYVP